MTRFDADHWALVLGGSSGFGLAAAKKLSAEGLNVFVAHRDRRGAMERIEREFDAIRANGRGFFSMNVDALSPEGADAILKELSSKMAPHGRLRVLLHSIAYGNLKPIAPLPDGAGAYTTGALSALAGLLQIPTADLEQAVRTLSEGSGASPLHALIPAEYGQAMLEDEDMARTIYAMGTSLLTWVQKIHAASLFASDARVFGLTSEGNEVAWRGYAAVSAAKAALESVSRAIAVELGPYGIRSNIIQAGITDTPALRVIPGSAKMKAAAQLRNPLGRLTTPEDVANVIYLLSLDEARWINGALIRVDGGEHIASA